MIDRAVNQMAVVEFLFVLFERAHGKGHLRYLLNIIVLRAILFLLPALAAAADFYLFTSFRGNGEKGVYFALSEDGYRWTPVQGNQPVVPPRFPGMLMRDPFVVKGPQGEWHLLWTTGWTRDGKNGRLTIGHAETRDLAAWGAQ